MTTKEELESGLKQVLEKDPMQFIQVMVLLLGVQCVDGNVGELTLSQEGDIDGKRYEMEATITIKPVESGG